MKKVMVFLYSQYADFEIAHALFFLRQVVGADIVTVSLDGNPVQSVGGLTTQVQHSLSDIDVRKFDLVLFPGGGSVAHIIGESMLSQVIETAYQSGVPIASICASATLLARAGILQNRNFTCRLGTYEKYKSLFEQATYTDKDIEVDDRVITAKDTAFAEFAVAICKRMGFLNDTEESEKALRFCKGMSV
ncbi:MAG: DJ-1/PfpI family protein [Alicyclobacillus sp.]|nr:DJ-1/PfpI family protein [Alicyclobacillus sp.]